MLTVTESIQQFLDARHGTISPKTEEINHDYLRSLVPQWGAREITTITLQDLERWRNELSDRPNKLNRHGSFKTKLSPHTVHGHVRVVKQFFAWLTRRGILSNNPAVDLKQVPISNQVAPSKMMTDADFEKMLAATQGDAPARIRDRAILWFLRQSGGRLGGVVNLTLENLELDRKRALVLEKGRGGGKLRYVYLKTEAVEAMREWLDMRAVLPQLCNRVFVTVPNDAGLGGGTPLSPGTIYAAYCRIAQRAKVTGKFNPHAQRHAFAKRMLRNGANLAAVSKNLGHSGIGVTHMHYGIYEDSEAADAHARYA
jgi:site-specific recombinase XerD